MRRGRVCLALLATACATAPAPAPPRVEAGGEILVGEWLGADAGLAVFRGIPYAAAPVGALRWRPPEAHPARPDPRDATRFGSACPQLQSNPEWYRDVAAGFGVPRERIPPLEEIAEDCLFLNVWTSALGTAEAQPVMVWIHGGGNRDGYAHEPNYRGRNLARHGVVVVSLQYRLGVLGFLAHPELSAESPHGVSGNYGLLDQIAALRWLRENVAAFGGDPGRVTVFGESAGAADIGTLMASPLARGLFQRAILQSGGYQLDRTETLGEAEAVGRGFAESFASGAELAALRAASWRELVEAAARSLADHDWDAVVDGWLLPRPAASIFRDGDQAEVDLLLGSNANEWLMYLPDPAAPGALEEAVPSFVLEKDRAEVIELLESGASGPAAQLDRLVGAAWFHCPSLAVARAQLRHTPRVFVYRFTRVRPGGGKLLAYHGAEIPYVFGTADPWLPAEATDRALGDTLRRYWVQFAKTGDPNAEGLPPWPAFRAESEDHQVLGDTVHAARGLDRELCRLLDRPRERFLAG